MGAVLDGAKLRAAMASGATGVAGVSGAASVKCDACSVTVDAPASGSEQHDPETAKPSCSWQCVSTWHCGMRTQHVATARNTTPGDKNIIAMAARRFMP